MELIYLYVGKIGRPIENFGIGFSRRFRVEFDAKSGKLIISKIKETLPESNIYGKNIADIDLIVGKNGSGKSTILSLLGLSKTERLYEYPIYLNKWVQTDETNKCTWFALYYIEKDYFAIEGNWCDTLEFMRGESFIHFQTLYSLCFQYDYAKQTGNIVNHLQDFSLGRKRDYHRKLFFLYYENPAILDWVTSTRRVKRHDLGSSSMFERVMCERMGYRGITKYLYDMNHKDEVMGFMGTKPGTVITISINDSAISEAYELSITSASDIVYKNPLGQSEIDVNKAAQYLYNGKVSLVKNQSIDALKVFHRGEAINNGLSYKEAFIIAYLEHIAVHCIMHQELNPVNDGNEMLKFSMKEKKSNQTQYEWQKWHLLCIINELLGENSLDYIYARGIVSGLERVPGECYINYTEMVVTPGKMRENFLDDLMARLDDSERDEDNHEINHRYYLKTEFKGISSGEARMIDIFAMLYNSLDCCCHKKGDTCVLLLDEPDVGFHPEWSRIFIEQLSIFLKSKMMRDYNYHIIISTHSPIMLSDVPRNCIHCISRDEKGNVTVTESEKYGLISGINDVLIDAFFTASVFGSFGEKYVNGIIKQLIEMEKQLFSKKQDSDSLRDILEKCEVIAERIENLGDGYIKDSLHNRLNRLRIHIKKLYNREW